MDFAAAREGYYTVTYAEIGKIIQLKISEISAGLGDRAPWERTIAGAVAQDGCHRKDASITEL
jgi:hypothetical protein